MIMDSPYLQSSTQTYRMRSSSNLSVHAFDDRSAIRKRSSERSRGGSFSTSQAERLHNITLEQSTRSDVGYIPPACGIEWITPQQSPQAQAALSNPSVEPFPTWTIPTPPRSDSGLPFVSVDAIEEPVTTGISGAANFRYEQPTASTDMRCVS